MDTVLYTVLGVQEAQIDIVLYTVWGSERVNDDNNNQVGLIRIVIISVLQTDSMYAQVARAQSCANHVQHIERLSCAACRVSCSAKGQLSC